MVTKLELAVVCAQRLALEQMAAAMKRAAGDLARKEAALLARLEAGEPVEAAALKAFHVVPTTEGPVATKSLRVRPKITP